VHTFLPNEAEQASFDYSRLSDQDLDDLERLLIKAESEGDAGSRLPEGG
jgi:hypothetical protein